MLKGVQIFFSLTQHKAQGPHRPPEQHFQARNYLLYRGFDELEINEITQYPLVFLVFSSPEPKVQVSFSDQKLSIVRRRCWRRCRHKLFTFSSSSPEPQGQFQPNLAQSILG